MNNITTLETSKALIAAGFPVPKPEVGQFWYDDKGGWYLVYATNQDTVSFMDYTGIKWPERYLENEGFAPAFAATDILRVLGNDWQLEHGQKYSGWNCEYFFRKEGSEKYIHVNPAEAAALAYLSKHKQQ